MDISKNLIIKSPAILSTKKRIGKIIEERRNELMMDVATLGDYSSVSTSLISNIQNGKSNATIETLEKLGDILGLELTMVVKKRG